MNDTPPASSNHLLAITTRLIVSLLLIGAAAAVFIGLRLTRPEVQQIDPTQQTRNVQVFAAQRIAVQRQWRGYGTAEAQRSADVPARVTATVAAIPDHILPGTRVTQGQLLVQLDDMDFLRQVEIAQQRIAEFEAARQQLDVEAARVQQSLALEQDDVTIAQTDYDRQVSLRDRNVNNAQDVDASQRTLINAKRARLQSQQAADLIGPRRRSLEAQIASQRSQVNLAQVNQQRTTITSPIDGVIQSIAVEVGESLVANQQVARIVALGRIEVPIQLPAAAREGVRVGDAVRLLPTNVAVGDRLLPGWSSTIVRINPEHDTATRTITVYAELTEEGYENRLPAPGMFLRAIVSVAEQTPRFVVPRRAIRKGRVQVVDDGVLVSRAVETAFTLSGPQPGLGLDDDQWAVIGEGLDEGELVLINAATQLADGTPVEPTIAGKESAVTSRVNDDPKGLGAATAGGTTP